MEKKYTIERFDKWLENQDNMHNELENVNELVLEGAKEYYSNVRHINNDYVTKSEVRETLDSAFDQFAQQSLPQQLIEDFANSDGIETEAVYFAIEQRKEEFIEYLSTFVDDIAEAANEEMDED